MDKRVEYSLIVPPLFVILSVQNKQKKRREIFKKKCLQNLIKEKSILVRGDELINILHMYSICSLLFVVLHFSKVNLTMCKVKLNYINYILKKKN